ncbi:hypothetical protein CERZMDRAFT_98918 [Cercospora zeae-maydis SCOH1-5]|uniref:Uncharacterized protein n=1 Tax=Cercospora zeae-maydis SCOH1-5 TaxID=717836 RepID=A0A6A6FCR0_9PEZI|nr:hypothetical protein CERZMDRAFT_98918 [Cercospora zeae-maydis SCOH1-5]
MAILIPPQNTGERFASHSQILRGSRAEFSQRDGGEWTTEGMVAQTHIDVEAPIEGTLNGQALWSQGLTSILSCRGAVRGPDKVWLVATLWLGGSGWQGSGRGDGLRRRISIASLVVRAHRPHWASGLREAAIPCAGVRGARALCLQHAWKSVGNGGPGRAKEVPECSPQSRHQPPATKQDTKVKIGFTDGAGPSMSCLQLESDCVACQELHRSGIVARHRTHGPCGWKKSSHNGSIVEGLLGPSGKSRVRPQLNAFLYGTIEGAEPFPQAATRSAQMSPR